MVTVRNVGKQPVMVGNKLLWSGETLRVSPSIARIASQEDGLQILGQIRPKFRFALAGKMKDHSQDEMAELLTKDGHKVSDLVPDVDFLVIGKGRTHRLQAEAKELGVKVITEDEMRDMLK